MLANEEPGLVLCTRHPKEHKKAWEKKWNAMVRLVGPATAWALGNQTACPACGEAPSMTPEEGA